MAAKEVAPTADPAELLRSLRQPEADRPKLERHDGARRRRRRAVVAGLLATALAAGLGVGVLTGGDQVQQGRVAEPSGPSQAPAVTVPPRAIPEGITSLEGARRTEDAELLLAYTGGNPLLTSSDWCWTGVVPELDFEADRVVVTLQRFRRGPGPPPPPGTGTGCTQEGYARTVAVALTEALAGRPLVDARTGEERPLFEDELLRPRYLPKGLELVVETGGAGYDERAWTTVFAKPQAPEAGRPRFELNLSLEVIQGPASVLAGERAAGLATQRMTVRGAVAELVDRDAEQLLRWTEGERGFVLSSDGLSPVELLAVARSLAP